MIGGVLDGWFSDGGVLGSAISSNSSALDGKHEISIGRLLDYGGVTGDGLLDSLLGAGGVLFGAISGSSSSLGSSLGRSLDYGGGINLGINRGLLDSPLGNGVGLGGGTFSSNGGCVLGGTISSNSNSLGNSLDSLLDYIGMIYDYNSMIDDGVLDRFLIAPIVSMVLDMEDKDDGKEREPGLEAMTLPSHPVDLLVEAAATGPHANGNAFITTSIHIPAAMRAAFFTTLTHTPAARRAAFITTSTHTPAAMRAAFITSIHIPAAMRAVVVRPLFYSDSVANSGHGSSPLSSALDDLGSLPLGLTLSKALDGHSRFGSAKVVAMFPMGHDEDENEEGGGDEDNDEDEEPGPKAMPSPGAMQPGVALVEAAATTSPMARALYRLQRLLN
jgi:hypothetical protein